MNVNGFNVSDCRLGVLSAVFFWLIPVWIQYAKQYEPLLERLKTLRRDLAFQRIDVNTALEKADEALDGMKAKSPNFFA